MLLAFPMVFLYLNTIGMNYIKLFQSITGIFSEILRLRYIQRTFGIVSVIASIHY